MLALDEVLRLLGVEVACGVVSDTGDGFDSDAWRFEFLGEIPVNSDMMPNMIEPTINKINKTGSASKPKHPKSAIFLFLPIP